MSRTARKAASTVYLRQYAVVPDSNMPWETGKRRCVIDFNWETLSGSGERKSETQWGRAACHGWMVLCSNGDIIAACLVKFSKLAARRPALPRFRRSYPWMV
jgi:hypothetical protein